MGSRSKKSDATTVTPHQQQQEQLAASLSLTSSKKSFFSKVVKVTRVLNAFKTNKKTRQSTAVSTSSIIKEQPVNTTPLGATCMIHHHPYQQRPAADDFYSTSLSPKLKCNQLISKVNV
jgi:hypothetical protein